MRSTRLPGDVRLFDPATLARLSRAHDYLAAHYNETNSLEDVASHAEFSPFYFNRLFAQAFDETPHEFVTRLRIDRAKKLLLAGNHSVTDICFEIGYESLGSFSTAFSRSPGCRRWRSGVKRGACSEGSGGVGLCTTYRTASRNSSVGCRKIRRSQESRSNPPRSRIFSTSKEIQR